MPTLIDRAGLREDRWTWFDGVSGDDPDAPVARAAGGAGSQLILSLQQWASHGEDLLASGTRVGLCLEPAEGPEAIAGVLERIALVAVRFPSFTDGRGYSTARLLRQRYGWKGELRAVGDILRDQVFYLARCGFDTFELRDGESVAEALAAFGDFSEPYQEAVDRGPLFRRRPPQPAEAANALAAWGAAAARPAPPAAAAVVAATASASSSATGASGASGAAVGNP